MKPIHNYLVLVDHYRAHYATPRATAGRYRVAAKTPEEAEELVKAVIGFGSPVVQFAYPDNDPQNIPYKKVMREVLIDVVDGKYIYTLEEATHATAPRKGK